MSRSTLIQITQQLGIPEAFVEQLVEEQIIEWSAADGAVVEEVVVERIRISWRLHDDLGVNLAGVEVALHLLERLQRERRDLAEALASGEGPRPSPPDPERPRRP